MKKIQKWCAVLLILLLPLLAAGCGKVMGADSGPCALSIVFGRRACSMEPNFSSKAVTDRVTETISGYGFVSAVSIDGDPSVIAAQSYDIPDQYKKADPVKLKADAKNKSQLLLMALQSVQADDAEADLLQALSLAVRSFASAPEDARRVILVIDSGVSTCGLLNFQNNLINGDPLAIASALQEKEAIPDLKGTTVIFQQLGDCAAPQSSLSPSQQAKLRSIWKAVVEAGGGSFLAEDDLPNPPLEDAVLPEVSPVYFPPESPVTLAEGSLAGMEEGLPILLDEKTISFLGDSDAYRDPEEAMESLKPVAEYMRVNPAFRLLLIGTTAGDEDSAYARSLSLARSEAVKGSLVSLGIDAGRIQTLGLGCRDPWHIDGAGTSGELAAQNRKVVMLSLESDLAGSLMK